MNSGPKQCVAVPVKDHSTTRIPSSIPTGRIPRQTGRPEYLAYIEHLAIMTTAGCHDIAQGAGRGPSSRCTPLKVLKHKGPSSMFDVHNARYEHLLPGSDYRRTRMSLVNLFSLCLYMLLSKCCY